jgi:hypothetical protein
MQRGAELDDGQFSLPYVGWKVVKFYPGQGGQRTNSEQTSSEHKVPNFSASTSLFSTQQYPHTFNREGHWWVDLITHFEENCSRNFEENFQRLICISEMNIT